MAGAVGSAARSPAPASAGRPVVELRGVTKRYSNRTLAVTGVDLDLRAGEPKVLLMDEPFAALDEITRQKLNDDLLALWATDRFTVVFVTHSVFESVYLSERIVVMAARPGRVIADLMTGAPFPRDAAFRTSPHYAAACRSVSARLLDAIAA